MDDMAMVPLAPGAHAHAVIAQSARSRHADPMMPFINGRGTKGACDGKCPWDCCKVIPSDWKEKQLLIMKNKWEAENEDEEQEYQAPALSEKKWRSRWHGRLRGCFPQLGCSRTEEEGFISRAQVAYERCMFDFFLGWSEDDMREIIQPGANKPHSYVLPKVKAYKFQVPTFQFVHCLTDGDQDALQRLVVLIHASKMDSLADLQKVELFKFSDRSKKEIIYPFQTFNNAQFNTLKQLAGSCLRMQWWFSALVMLVKTSR